MHSQLDTLKIIVDNGHCFKCTVGGKNCWESYMASRHQEDPEMKTIKHLPQDIISKSQYNFQLTQLPWHVLHVFGSFNLLQSIFMSQLILKEHTIERDEERKGVRLVIKGWPHHFAALHSTVKIKWCTLLNSFARFCTSSFNIKQDHLRMNTASAI